MGDISELRGLIVVGTFLAITVLLIAWIPSEFYTVEGQRTIEPPEYFEASDVWHMNFTYQIDIPDSEYMKHWGKSQFGHDMLFYANHQLGKYFMQNSHVYTFLGIPTGGHAMHWINDEGTDRGKVLWEDKIEADWNSEKKLASYTVKCDHFYMKSDIAYNTTLYSSIHDAWSHGDLHLLFGINWDQRGTTYDAWSLISGVLFFKMPTINPYVNALIAVPMWISIAYLAFILVLRAVGAIFGGGA